MSWSGADVRRYSRHLLLPEIGLAGQTRLRAASVLLLGAGGLGSPAAMYLAAAGVGRLGLVDGDTVDPSNLQRQIIHGEGDVGKNKVDSAAARLAEINAAMKIDKHATFFSRDNAMQLVADYDLVIDGTDNFPTRYLANDACVLLNKPYVYASIFRFEGQVSVFDARVGPCYRCLYPQPPPPGVVPTCAEGGVLGVLPGVVGTLQATEALKLLTGAGEPLHGRLLRFDALSMRFSELRLKKDPSCALCGSPRRINALIDYDKFCGVPAHDRANEKIVDAWSIRPRELAHRLRDVALLDVRSPHEWEICRLRDAKHIPLEELPDRVHELDSAVELVVYCKMGSRSRDAIELLRAAGFGKVKSLVGGINAWSLEVDKDVPLY